MKRQRTVLFCRAQIFPIDIWNNQIEKKTAAFCYSLKPLLSNIGVLNLFPRDIGYDGWGYLFFHVDAVYTHRSKSWKCIKARFAAREITELFAKDIVINLWLDQSRTSSTSLNVFACILDNIFISICYCINLTYINY